MSNPTVVSAIRSAFASAQAFGLAPVVTVRQFTGVYNPATGAEPAPAESTPQILIENETDTGDGPAFRFLVLADDLSAPLVLGAQVVFDDKQWNVTAYDLDPTRSVYYATAER